MQSSDTQSGCCEQPLFKAKLAASGVRCIAPGALASYFQAQQAWRRTHAAPKHGESSSHQLNQASLLSGAASANSTSSCITSARHLEASCGHNLPPLGCRSVARLFQQRQELMTRHRHQRQAAKRRRLAAGAPLAPAGLLSLPEDVLVMALAMIGSN